MASVVSLSLRRAWIEIDGVIVAGHTRLSRSPYGERGLKSQAEIRIQEVSGRSPYGERGLKYCLDIQIGRETLVALLTESVD